MEFAKRMDCFGEGIFSKLAEIRRRKEAAGEEVIDLSIGAPNIPPAPHVMQALCEAAADPELLPIFWGMGVRELSMSPGAIIRSRAVLANWRAEDCRSLAEQVLLCGSRQEVQDILARTNGQQNARQV